MAHEQPIQFQLADPKRPLAADLATRRLGASAGLLQLRSADAQSAAVSRLATQAQTEILISLLWQQSDVHPGLRRLYL
ncbi:MAG: hypothetical protein LJE69_00285 [Thiohalocapsa sp.]|jgi:hypothetical protein|uniref:hypothetical protein n=1 Tax=Thiohalocapsa sp. TaxID=2497641 RepID=UPI0025E7B94E|nr:hypothetical protein [Thiohalocapsa sp.]MCG6939675.1 hypothetical protein [Thiohalocapsa sp.]